MTAPASTDGQPTWGGRALLDGNGDTAPAVREAVQRLLWNGALRIWCGGVRVLGCPADGPVVYAANHASHADTVAIRAAVGTDIRRRLAVAAAADYFFRDAIRARVFSIAVGAFPFPRQGAEGLSRARSLLERGWGVLLYPEGTRDADGELRPGVLRLAADGWPVVPVGVSGTGRVLPKGARWPRSHPVAVAFGEALGPQEATAGGMPALAAAIGAAARRAETATR